MPYDADLAERLREVLAPLPDITERVMFGGLAFLLGGQMAVAASGRGGLMLRVDPQDTDNLVQDGRAHRFVMRGRELDGWLYVEIGADVDDDELRRWITVGLDRVRTLPAT